MTPDIKKFLRGLAGAKSKKRQSDMLQIRTGEKPLSTDDDNEDWALPPVPEAALGYYGVDWTAEKIEVLRDCYSVWKVRNGPLFQVRSAYLLGKFQNQEAVRLAESAKMVLLQTGHDPLNLQAFTNDLSAMLKEISKNL